MDLPDSIYVYFYKFLELPDKLCLSNCSKLFHGLFAKSIISDFNQEVLNLEKIYKTNDKSAIFTHLLSNDRHKLTKVQQIIFPNRLQKYNKY